MHNSVSGSFSCYKHMDQTPTHFSQNPSSFGHRLRQSAGTRRARAFARARARPRSPANETGFRCLGHRFMPCRMRARTVGSARRCPRRAVGLALIDDGQCRQDHPGGERFAAIATRATPSARAGPWTRARRHARAGDPVAPLLFYIIYIMRTQIGIERSARIPMQRLWYRSGSRVDSTRSSSLPAHASGP